MQLRAKLYRLVRCLAHHRKIERYRWVRCISLYEHIWVVLFVTAEVRQQAGRIMEKAACAVAFYIGGKCMKHCQAT